MFQGTLYDGATAYPHRVQVSVGADSLALVGGDGWTDEVAATKLQRIGEGGELRLAHRDHPGWRLILPAEAEQAVRGLIGKGERYGRWIDRIGLAPALITAAIVTGCVVAVGYLSPAWIAPHVPRSWERNLGNAMVGDFGDNRCRNADGQRALERLVERLSPGATTGPEQIKVAALDIDMFNAAALPGGHIVVFKSAITETESVEALSGIVAHEIAHIRRRHVTEALIRELGIGALVRLFAGNIGSNAQELVALSYTRENEEEADRDAIAMLNRAGISPEPTGKLFQHLAEDMGEGGAFDPEVLRSHPLSTDRAQRFLSAAEPGRNYGPALSNDDSEALFNICYDGPRPAAGVSR